MCLLLFCNAKTSSVKLHTRCSRLPGFHWQSCSPVMGSLMVEVLQSSHHQALQAACIADSYATGFPALRELIINFVLPVVGVLHTDVQRGDLHGRLHGRRVQDCGAKKG